MPIENSLLPEERVKVLKELVDKAKPLKGATAELGVYNGGVSVYIAKNCGGDTHYAIDTYEGLPDTLTEKDNTDTQWKGRFKPEIDVEKLLKQIKNIKIVKGFFPKCVKKIKATKFKLVHFDGDLYQSAKDFCEYFYGKIIKGGIMIFDDYARGKNPGVSIAVEEFMADKKETIHKPVLGYAYIVKE